MIPTLRLHRPGSLAQAVGLLAELGDEARIHAGGTELVLMLREGFLSAAHLVDIKGVAEAGVIREDRAAGMVVLGATARHDQIALSPLVRDRLPVLADLEGRLANQRVRNAGTIGGNLAFAEPHADPPALLVAAGARLRLVGRDGERDVPLDGWILGPYESDLAPGELLTEVRIPVPAPGTCFGYRRFKALERPSVTVAARLDVDDAGRITAARVVLGCLGGAPQTIAAADELLVGLELASLEAALAGVTDAVEGEAQAASDPHGPGDYKRHLAGVLAARALRDAAGAAASGTAGARP
jgi:carbon-monoxide dehydrogenase medium subunit